MTTQLRNMCVYALPRAASVVGLSTQTVAFHGRRIAPLLAAALLCSTLFGQRAFDAAPRAEMGKRTARGASALPGARMTTEQRAALAAFPSGVEVQFDWQEVPSFVSGTISSRVHPDDPVAEAQAVLQSNGAAFRLRASDTFTASWVEQDQEGGTHVHMAQMYNGVSVDGGELTVHMTRDVVSGITGRFVADLSLETGKPANSGSAVAAALAFVDGSAGQNPEVVGLDAPMIYLDRENAAHVVVPVRTASGAAGARSEQLVFVDADSGAVLGERTAVPQPNAPTPGYGQLIVNPGFESGQVAWTGSTSCGLTICGLPIYKGTPTTAGYIGPRTGAWYAKLNGRGRQNTERLAQQVNIPANATSASLRYWVRITTAECTMNALPCPEWDTMWVQIVASNGSTSNLALYSNLIQPAWASYRQTEIDVTRFKGQTITLQFVGSEDSSLATAFYIDDVTLNYAYSTPF